MTSDILNQLGTPPAEFEMTPELVARLIAQQYPDLAQEPLGKLDSGWDNDLYRLGERHLVRLPRRAIADDLAVKEQLVLRTLANRLPVDVPLPIHVGQPDPKDTGYPWHWSIVPWFDGQTASDSPLNPREAKSWAQFLAALHQSPTNEAGGITPNPYRGVPLQVRAEALEPRLARVREKSDAVSEPIIEIWTEALAADVASATQWVHGDLHARNVLTERGSLVAVIDWGDVTVGDVATDLASIWMLFDDRAARAVAMRRYESAAPADPELWRRARGWAVVLGVVLLDSGLIDHPEHAAMGRRTLENLLAD